MLQEKAMLIDLTISVWTATKFDKSVSAEVEKAHDAKDAGRYNKRLVPKEQLDEITKQGNAIRDFHYSRTLPWSDKGVRLLPSAMFFDYNREYQQLRDKFNRLVDAFIRDYPQMVDDARSRLKTLFKADDYPTPQQLRHRFQISMEIMPVPAAGDFRADISTEATEGIRDNIRSAIAERQQRMLEDVKSRVKDVMTRLYVQCTADKPIIRESLIEGARELSKLLHGLNVMDDPKIAGIALVMETHMHSVDMSSLRKSSAARGRMANVAQDILKQLQ
jgi:hypothetical protein